MRSLSAEAKYNVRLCAIVLAGGKGRRLNYQYKPLLRVGSRYLIERVIESLQNPLIDSIFIYVKSRLQAGLLKSVPILRSSPKLDIMLDIAPEHHPLVPILSAYVHLGRRYTHVVVLSCDLPLISRRLVDALIAHVNLDVDAVVPQWSNGLLEPLAAIYSMRTIARVYEALQRKEVELSTVPVRELVRRAGKVVYIRAEEFEKELVNINSMLDLELALTLCPRQ